MISTQLPDKAYQLAAQYEMGKPVRVYRTNKRPMFKTLGYSMVFTYLFCMAIVFSITHLHPSKVDGILYGIFIGILIFLALLFFIPLLLFRPTIVYICASGFIIHHKSKHQAIRWEEVDWISSNPPVCVVHLTNQQRVIVSRDVLFGPSIEDVAELAQEIELKARLAQAPAKFTDLEWQFERNLSRQIARNQEKENISAEKLTLMAKEAPEEAFKLQEEYELGEVLATYHAGFRGILRQGAVARPIYYLLLLAMILPVIGAGLDFTGQLLNLSLPSILTYLPSQYTPIYLVFIFLISCFWPRFTARPIRLHLYTDGFIYIEASLFEVVRLEQIEKIVYPKTSFVLSAPFCYIYIKTGGKLAINGYMHEQNKIKQMLNEYTESVPNKQG